MDADNPGNITSDDFLSIIASSADGFTLVDTSGNIIDVNKSYCQMMGYTREELLNIHFSDVDAVDTDVDVAKRINEIIERGSLRFVTKHRHKSGSAIDVEVSANYNPLHGGLIFSIVRDITQQQKAANALRLSEERYRNIVENQTEFVVRYLPGGVLTFVNDALVRFVAIPATELLGRSFYPFIHEAEREEAIALIESISRENPVVYTENRIVLPDGRIRWSRWTQTGIFDENGAIVEYQSVGRDITKYKQAEEALQESESRFKGAFEHSAIGMAFVSPEGKWLKVNSRIPEMLGYSEEELLTKTFQDITHPGDLEADMGFVRQMLNGEIETYSMEKRYYHKQGHIIWILLSVSLVRNINGSPLHFISQIENITDRKQAEIALQKSETILQSSQVLAKIGGWQWDVEHQSMTWTEETYRIHDIEPFSGTPGFADLVELSLNCYSPEDRPRIHDAFKCCIERGESYDMDCSFTSTTGRKLRIRTAAQPEWHGDRVVRVTGNIMDITEQKLTEDQLKEAEWKFRALFENGPIGVAYHRMVYDDSGKAVDYFFIDANENYITLTGVDPRGKTVTQAFPGIENDPFDWIGTFEKVARTGETIHFEQYLQLNNRWYDVVCYQYKPDHFVASFTEITERKKAEERLKHEQDMLARTESISHIGSWEWDVVTEKVTWSDELFRIFQLNPADGAPSVEEQSRIYNPEDMKELLRVFGIAVNEGTPYEIESRIIRPNGEIRICLARGFAERGAEGKVTRLFGSFQDITERKQAEEYLKKVKDLLSEGQKIAHMGTFEYVVDTQELVWSEEEYRIYGLNPEEPPPTYDFMLANCIHPDDAVQLQQAFSTALQNSSVYEILHRIVRPDGSVRWLHNVANPYFDQNNKFARYVGITLDITESKRAEEEKLALEHQIQQTQRLESLGVLAGGIAHDFNNILAIIMGYCSLTKMNYDTAEKNIPEMEKAVERAAALCRQMLAYAGKAPFEKTQVDMGMVVTEMSRMLQSTIAQNVVIKPELSSDVPCVIGDASQIRQVVMNLIINAAEAIGDAQGEVRVSLSKKVLNKEGVAKDYLGKIIPYGCYACLEVADTGCGMSDKTYNRLFEPFYTTKFYGRGLGMSAVLGIINTHNGALQLSSEPGKGTIFTIYLPAQISYCAGEESLQQASSTPWQGSGTILLVEDEAQVLQIARTMLQRLGFTVIEASNGKQALELYLENAADIRLVITDIGMPVMDGYQLFSELKTLRPDLPIIISSGFGDTVVESRIASEDIAGSISKPYSFDRLREVLTSVEEGIQKLT